MSPLDRDLLAERLPPDPAGFRPGTDASDAVILHLWQAVQIVIDLALSACLHLRLGTPASYADAFHRLAGAGALDPSLADRLVRAAGFRNVIAHADDTLDMVRVHRAVREGPADLPSALEPRASSPDLPRDRARAPGRPLALSLLRCEACQRRGRARGPTTWALRPRSSRVFLSSLRTNR